MYKYLFLFFLSLTLLEVKGQGYAKITSTEDDMYAPKEDDFNNQDNDLNNQEEDEMIIPEMITKDMSYDEEASTDAITNQCTCNNKLPASCQDIYRRNPRSKSGKYDIYANGIKIRVYCRMGSLCGTKGGWTRLAYLNMKKKPKCPSGFKLYKHGNIKACGRTPTSGGSCQPVTFPSSGIHYSQVCGRVVGYQYGSPDGLDSKYWNVNSKRVHDPNHNNINSYYVDGVSITRGCPRKHVFTFIGGLQENYAHAKGEYQCPCHSKSKQKIQHFIGRDYFCESGNPNKGFQFRFYTNDKLWDGKQCGSAEKKCCKSKTLPYFHKAIGTTTNDDLELRVCADQGTNDEDTPVSFYDIYVK